MDIFLKGDFEVEKSPNEYYKKIRIDENNIERLDIEDNFDNLLEKMNGSDGLSQEDISYYISNKFDQEEKLEFIRDILMSESWDLGIGTIKDKYEEIFKLMASDLNEDIEDYYDV